ncbi:M66 family metalloprotease [Massilia antarctica]|uniref:M66 family metalloprotease n=1 Tax=Massilia antarctica TaxID=2765360 RepID=UPI0009E69DF9|nr:M66 family metalloprotease [Massilia sp. H27-R4]MCY0911000.1 M66 family metalloprotease [Massilia sp. H27-R4]
MRRLLKYLAVIALSSGVLTACGDNTGASGAPRAASADAPPPAASPADANGAEVGVISGGGANAGSAAEAGTTGIAAPIANATTMGVAAAASTTQWTFCANENSHCVFTGYQTVRYGAGDRFVSKSLGWNAACNNATFGDPAPGVAKHCEITSTWEACGVEGGQCAFADTRTVRFGSGTSFMTKTGTGGLACNSNVFGDPTPGIAKHCDKAPVTWTLCATEGGRCNFSGTNAVLFGAAGKFYTYTKTDGVDCTVAAMANPAPGLVKNCYVPGAPIADAIPPVSGDPRIGSIQLAQSQLFDSADSALILINGKAVMVKVNALSNNPGVAKPDGKVQVKDANGNVLREIALNKPAGALPASVPVVPDANTSYIALVPSDLVRPGLRLSVVLSNGQSKTINPRVGGGVPMELVSIPVQIGSSVGRVVGNLREFVQDRIPVSNVNQRARATYVSSRVTRLPVNESEWSDAFGKILGEMADLHTLEGANDRQHYFGIIPKATYGLAGLAYVPGTSGVAADIPSMNEDGLRGIVVHELGHNYRLNHAACGGAGSPDPKYPYPNAQLGTGTHYTWGYLVSRSAFFDPRNTNTHDIMSYCGGSTFSDYNTHLMQAFLTPADALMITSAVNDGPQDLILVSGQISGDTATLSPVKSYVGRARLPAKGEYTLHIVTAKGVLDYPFATLVVDHAEDMKSQNFSLSIPNPGQIVSISVVKGKSNLMQSSARPIPEIGLQRAVAAVQVREQAGKVQLSWDHTRYPYLTVTLVTDTARSTLAQDLRNGSAVLSTGPLPAGGVFEFSLSDGVNTTLVKQARDSAL